MGKCECGRLKGNPCGPLRPNTINVTMPFAGPDKSVYLIGKGEAPAVSAERLDVAGARGSFGEIGQDRGGGRQPLFTKHGLFSHAGQTKADSEKRQKNRSQRLGVHPSPSCQDPVRKENQHVDQHHDAHHHQTLASLPAFGSEHATVAILPLSGGLVLGGIGYRNGFGNARPCPTGRWSRPLSAGSRCIAK